MKAQTTTAQPQTIWTYLYTKLGNAYGTAGLMGNLYAESGLIANNLQNSYNTSLGMTDKGYTDSVDNGGYTKFASDSAGYGLAQWTYGARKKNLLTYAKEQDASIGNLEMQLAFLYQELQESYPAVLSTLQSAKSVKEASDVVLLSFEKPADQSESVKAKRESYGQNYYAQYATTDATTSTTTTASTVTEKTASDTAKSYDKSLAGTYTTTANVHLRQGAGTGKASMVVLPSGTRVKHYGYFTSLSGTKWLYVQVTYQNVKYTGFCSGNYLKKV